MHADFGNKLTKALAQYKIVSFKLAKTTSIENEDTQFINLNIPVGTVTLQSASCNISSPNLNFLLIAFVAFKCLICFCFYYFYSKLPRTSHGSFESGVNCFSTSDKCELG